ncbi:MAG: hypothetical protein M1831_001024 [Alyxoria varia]|nr:MAG: hypothetical protein M1831_001024 [Alyxoria varia]
MAASMDETPDGHTAAQGREDMLNGASKGLEKTLLKRRRERRSSSPAPDTDSKRRKAATDESAQSSRQSSSDETGDDALSSSPDGNGFHTSIEPRPVHRVEVNMVKKWCQGLWSEIDRISLQNTTPATYLNISTNLHSACSAFFYEAETWFRVNAFPSAYNPDSEAIKGAINKIDDPQSIGRPLTCGDMNTIWHMCEVFVLRCQVYDLHYSTQSLSDEVDVSPLLNDFGPQFFLKCVTLFGPKNRPYPGDFGNAGAVGPRNIIGLTCCYSNLERYYANNDRAKQAASGIAVSNDSRKEPRASEENGNATTSPSFERRPEISQQHNTAVTHDGDSTSAPVHELGASNNSASPAGSNEHVPEADAERSGSQQPAQTASQTLDVGASNVASQSRRQNQSGSATGNPRFAIIPDEKPSSSGASSNGPPASKKPGNVTDTPISPPNKLHADVTSQVSQSAPHFSPIKNPRETSTLRKTSARRLPQSLADLIGHNAKKHIRRVRWPISDAEKLLRGIPLENSGEDGDSDGEEGEEEDENESDDDADGVSGRMSSEEYLHANAAPESDPEDGDYQEDSDELDSD